MQFHLINTTILFIAREGFRRACLRIDQSAAGASRRVLRIAALTVPAGAVLATGVTAALLHSVGSSGDAAYRQALLMQGDMAAAVALGPACSQLWLLPLPCRAARRTRPPPPLPAYLAPAPAPAGLAAFVEVLSEPLYILASTRLLFGLRVGVETAAMTAKGVLTLALVRHSPGSMPPAIAFSWGQLAYAGVTLAGYAAYFLPQLLRAVRKRQQAWAGAGPAAEVGARADGDILRLSGTFTLQASVRGLSSLNCCRENQGCMYTCLPANQNHPRSYACCGSVLCCARPSRRRLRSWCWQRAARWRWLPSRVPAGRVCMGWSPPWAPSWCAPCSSPLRRPPLWRSARRQVGLAGQGGLVVDGGLQTVLPACRLLAYCLLLITRVACQPT